MQAPVERVPDGILEKLGRDIERGKVARFDPAVVDRWMKLVENVEIDPDTDEINEDVGL